MAIAINTGFHVGAALPIDDRQYLSFEEMRTINEDIYPDEFVVTHKGTGDLYTYSKTNEFDEETGKFRMTMLDSFPLFIIAGDAENENGNNDLGDGGTP